GAGSQMYLLALLGSYYVSYYSTTFNEVVAGFLTLAFTIACFYRTGWPWIFGLFVAAGTTKEVAAPMLLALGIAPLWMESAKPEWRKPHLYALAAGFGLTVALLAGFNHFRFGQLQNAELLDPLLRVPTPKQYGVHLAALWVSPNGGLLAFATLPILIILSAAAWTVSRAVSRKADRSDLPAVSALIILIALSVGFAQWYSPFGWWAWGPRLHLPWIPALLWLVLFCYPERLNHW